MAEAAANEREVWLSGAHSHAAHACSPHNTGGADKTTTVPWARGTCQPSLSKITESKVRCHTPPCSHITVVHGETKKRLNWVQRPELNPRAAEQLEAVLCVHVTLQPAQHRKINAVQKGGKTPENEGGRAYTTDFTPIKRSIPIS